MNKEGDVQLLSEKTIYYILAAIAAILLFLLIYTRGKMFLP